MGLGFGVCFRISNSSSNNSLADNRWTSGNPQANGMLGEKLQLPVATIQHSVS